MVVDCNPPSHKEHGHKPLCAETEASNAHLHAIVFFLNQNNSYTQPEQQPHSTLLS